MHLVFLVRAITIKNLNNGYSFSLTWELMKRAVFTPHQLLQPTMSRLLLYVIRSISKSVFLLKQVKKLN